MKERFGVADNQVDSNLDGTIIIIIIARRGKSSIANLALPLGRRQNPTEKPHLTATSQSGAQPQLLNTAAPVLPQNLTCDHPPLFTNNASTPLLISV